VFRLSTHLPSGSLVAYPLSTIVAGAMKSGARKIFRACSSNRLVAASACVAPRQYIQPVDGQPRANVIANRRTVSIPIS